MTDVYISCAREDARQMGVVAEALRAEGWTVWFEPDAALSRREHAIDAELGAAGAVIVMWSAISCGSEFVRTEAATGLYRNKLIQVSFGEASPPRPFDQLELVDLSAWNGDPADPTWQQIIGRVRLFAGAPGADRPQVVRNSAAGFGSQAALRDARPPDEPVFEAAVEDTAEPAPVMTGALGVASSEPSSGSVTAAEAQEPPPSPPGGLFAQPDAPPAAEEAVAETQAFTPSGPEPAATFEAPAEAPLGMPREVVEAAPEPEAAPEAAPELAPLFPPASEEPAQQPAVEAEPEPWASSPADPTPFPERRREPSVRPGARARAGLPEEGVVGAGADGLMAGSGVGGRIGAPPPRSGSANGIAPVAIVGLLAVVGGGLWFVDPMGWREGGEQSAFADASSGAVETLSLSGSVALAASGPLVDDPEAEEIWAGVDREDPDALRTFILSHRESMSAEQARAVLRVLDSQAWADAVTADVESGYRTYLISFPAPTGEMAGAAASRLRSLGEERRQAIDTIQAQLRELAMYDGARTGVADETTQAAVNAFVRQFGGTAPDIADAAPRDLRALGDRVFEQVRATAGSVAVAERPQPASPPSVERPAPEPEAPAVSAPAPSELPVAEGVVEVEAEAAASVADEFAAWELAAGAGTVESYARFLQQYPDSIRVGAAEAAITQLSRPTAYDLDWLTADTRAMVVQARAAQNQAQSRASAARQVAEEADEIASAARSGLSTARTVIAPDGDIYETETAGGQPNGLGVRTAGDAQSSGDRYRGQLSNGLGQGLGVYEYGDNPNNQAAQALRYEGEHAGDVASGFGVTQWRNGNRFEGQDSGEVERGVLAFASGQRYEGELLNGVRHGFGVFWTGEGDVMMAGRWENGDLVEPMAPWAGPDIGALVAAAAPAEEVVTDEAPVEPQ